MKLEYILLFVTTHTMHWILDVGYVCFMEKQSHQETSSFYSKENIHKFEINTT